jgi:site-specific DNA-methyltransferase (adenine-specific)
MFESFGNSEHKIYLGDACEVLNGELADDSLDLVFADPPYNIGKNFNGRKDRWPSDKDYLSWCY